MLLSLLFDRKWMILAIAAASVAIAAAIVFAIPSRYVAQSVVVIGKPEAQVVALQPVVSSLELNPHALQAQVETEMQIIRSRRVGEQLIARLGLANDPEFNPALRPLLPDWVPEGVRAALLDLVERFWPHLAKPEDIRAKIEEVLGRRISVQPLGRSTALAISANSADPDKAALIANTLADLYVHTALNEKVAATERALAALGDRLGELQRTVVASDHAVEEYRMQAGLYDREDAGTFQQITEIRTQITLAQAQIATASARLAQLRASRGGVSAAAEVLSSRTIERLRDQESAIGRELRDVLTRLGDRHPQAIGLRSALEGVRQQIRDETDKIAASIEAEVRVATQREQSLRQTLAEIERQTGERNQASVRLRELRREADANRKLYEVFLQRYQEVVQQIGLQQPDAKVISQADRPSSAAWPPKLLLLGLAGIGSTAITTLFLVLREILRGRLRSSDDVFETLQMPTMAMVPKLTMFERIRSAPEDVLLSGANPTFGESIQLIRLQLGRMRHGGAGRVVHFTSSIGGEGKTSVAVACARLAARAGQKVVMVDCDLRRSRIERIFGKSRFGLADLLTRRCTLEEAKGVDQATGLSYIAAHPGSARFPADLLGGAAMQELMMRLVEDYDLVVVDTPPILAAADALALAPFVDVTLFIVDAERTPRNLVRAALDRLAQAGFDIGGIVLSKVRSRHVHEYGYGSSGPSTQLVPRRS